MLPHRRHCLAFQALRELQFMQIFLISVLASASGNLAIGSPAEREREIPYLTLTAPDRRNGSNDSSTKGGHVIGRPLFHEPFQQV